MAPGWAMEQGRWRRPMPRATAAGRIPPSALRRSPARRGSTRGGDTCGETNERALGHLSHTRRGWVASWRALVDFDHPAVNQSRVRVFLVVLDTDARQLKAGDRCVGEEHVRW